MSQQEVIQFLKENYNYDKDSRKLIINDQQYSLHVTKTSFELHEDREDTTYTYVDSIKIEESIHVEIIRRFNIKEIPSTEVLDQCIQQILLTN